MSKRNGTCHRLFARLLPLSRRRANIRYYLSKSHATTTLVLTQSIMEESEENDTNRSRSLNRFQESLKQLDPPAWIRQQSPLPPVSVQEPKTRTRPRYSDHRRSYSAQRGTMPSASASFWRTTTTSSSRGPSPGPGSRPATAAGRFQSSQFGRWSASTLCSDGQLSNGDNTPTDSVCSAFSTRSSFQTTEPIYHPPTLLPVLGGRHTGSGVGTHLHTPVKRPYLGWRSQDSLINGTTSESRYLTPAERLAWSCKHQQKRDAMLANGAKHGSDGGGLHPHPHPRHARLLQQHNMLVHDSIKSVSTAIMEFCQAEDVPQPPPPQPPVGPVRRRKEQRAQIVWLESSFISKNPSFSAA